MSLKEELISVIIPVYNVEQYLDECMESVVNQTYKNIQIIMINDGSTDSSPIICDKWAQKDNRIDVIHTENNGLSEARNIGIEHSKGRYIAFVDSDDLINKSMLEILYNNLIDANADMSICTFKHFENRPRKS